MSPFTPKDWRDDPDHTTPISAAALEDLETRLSAYTDTGDAAANAAAIPKTIADAKGDLIAATAADTVARKAVGTNGQVLVADSAQSTGLAWSNDVAVRKEAMPSLKDPEFGAVGTGVGSIAADTAAFAAFMASGTNTVMVPEGEYWTSAMIDTTSAGNKRMVGQGGFGNPGLDSSLAPTTIRSSFDGTVFRMNGHNCGLEDLMIYGDSTKTAQIPLDIGDPAGATPTSKFSVKRVHLKGSGFDNLRVRGLVLESEFEQLYSHGAVRHCAYVNGNEQNVITWRNCFFREATQWGMLVQGGFHHFDTCVFESNSKHASVGYGGLRMGESGASALRVVMSACHFEANNGPVNLGRPWHMAAHGHASFSVTENLSFYGGEAIGCLQEDGTLVSISPMIWTSPHLTINSGADGAQFFFPGQGVTTLAVNGSGASKVMIADFGAASGGPRIQLGGDRYLQRSMSSGRWEIDYLDIQELGVVGKQMVFFPFNAASASNGGLYLETADDRLYYKTYGGLATPLEATGVRLPVRVASTTNVTLTAPGATIDGVTMVSGDRMLLKDQTAAAANGLYVWNGAASTATRALDANSAAKISDTLQVTVDEGTMNADTVWTLQTAKPITLGTTVLRFLRLSPGYNFATRDPWSHGGNAVAATMDRNDVTNLITQTAITAICSFHGGMVVPAGRLITNINAFCTAAGSGAVTLFWWALVRQSDRVVLQRSANSTTLPTVDAVHTRTLQAAITLDYDTPCYIALATQVATTSPSFAGVTGLATSNFSAPILTGNSSTTPTSTPPTVGAVLGAPAAGNTGRIHAWLS